MSWPENPYLAAYLRSPEGQAYLEKYGCLDAWKRRHLLDPDVPLSFEVVSDPDMPPNALLFRNAWRWKETTEDSLRQSVLVTNAGLPEAWDF